MSVANPPIIVTSIYNPAFFEASAADSITQAQANALYLKKTTADTATALETFNAGIATTTAGISGLATVGTTLGVTGVLTASSGVVTSNVNTGASTTLALGATDTIELGCGGSRGAATVSIGTAGTGNVNISNAITNTVRLFSSTQGTNHQFDNINLIDNTTGAMSLFNSQVGGALNIGTSTTRTGAINIGKSGGTHLINIDTSSTSGTAIQIGTSASAKTVKINNSSGSVHISAIDIQGTGINGTVPLTGNISLADLQTSGVLNIGTGARVLTGNGGVINIGTGSVSVLNPINIGGIGSVLGLNGSTVTVGLNSNAINIGNGFSTTTISGNTSLATIFLDNVDRLTNGTLQLGTTSTSTAITIGSTTKIITIGALKINADTNLVLDNVSATAEIYIGNNQVSGTGGISIGTSALRSSNIAIGSTNASVIAIGGTGLTTIGSGGLTTTGLLNANAGLTMGTSNNITLGNGTVQPTSGTQLGSIIYGSAVPTGAQSTGFTVSTINITNPGVYLLSMWLQNSFTVLPTQNYITLTIAPTVLGTNYLTGVAFGFETIVASSNLGCDFSIPITVSTTGNISANYNLTGNITALKGVFIATRIG